MSTSKEKEKAKWITHTQDGKSYTSKTHYPWDVPEEEITSVERIVAGGKHIIIGKSDGLSAFFVKMEEGIDFAMMGKNPGQRPKKVHKEVVGCHIAVDDDNIYRLELAYVPRNGSVVLTAKKVKKITKDGF